MNNHGINVGYIKPGLNNRGRHKHVNIAVDKVVHDVFQLPLLHLAVRKSHLRLRHKLGNRIRHFHDRIHFIINIIHLSPA